MFGFKLLAVAALACAVVAHDSACAAPTTVTITVTECATRPIVNPAPTPPGPGSYSPPDAPPASSVVSTATAPLSSHPPHDPTGVAPSSGAPVAPPSSGAPVAPPSSGTPVAPSSGVAHSSTASAPGTTPAPSSTAANNRPSSSASPPAMISTAGAALPTPYIKLGSIVAAGAAAMVVVV